MSEKLKPKQTNLFLHHIDSFMWASYPASLQKIGYDWFYCNDWANFCLKLNIEGLKIILCQ
jgi:hypothetical protein